MTRRELVLGYARLPADLRMKAVMRLTPAQRRGLLLDWRGWAMPGQAPPDGAWRVWLLRGGRGFGKTHSGAAWVVAQARATPKLRIALLAASLDEARAVMVEGESGLLNLAASAERPQWLRDNGELRFTNGSIATIYSAAAPDKLRGPQHHYAWCDELAKWRYGNAAWDNLMMGLRLGTHPQVVVTTTPRPTALVRRVMALPDCVQTRGSTHDNLYLPGSVVAALEADYGGTRLGRQELDGELLEDHEGALWTRAMLDRCVDADVPVLRRVIVAVDPPASTGGDACGIVAAGVDADGIAWVLEDASVQGASPGGWARAVAGCAARAGADRVVAEANQGGDMVTHVLRGADAGLPVKLVHASRGKLARAEPVAHLYEREQVRHAGAFPELCDELCGMVVGGVYAGPGRSPDRADALVWALTELCLGGRQGEAAVRVV
ncbi:DNA-packaging protein [Sphingomonas sp.]|uniref:DNA-packaging protein n=1 Tax=Sphingomonas sp. TaxID=28214 RepID=UPI003CC5F71F